MKSEHLNKIAVQLRKIMSDGKTDKVVEKKLTEAMWLIVACAKLEQIREKSLKRRQVEEKNLKLQEKKLLSIASRINTVKKRVAPSERKI